MQDRVSLYPGRVKLIPVTGQENTYDMVRADEPTQEGTPLNADSLLKVATAALYGLGAAAVPDDVLALIKPMIDSNYSELSSLANSKARIETGTYTGNGDLARSFTCSFKPELLILTQTHVNTFYTDGRMVFVKCDSYGCSFGLSRSTGSQAYGVLAKLDGNTVTIQGESANIIANEKQSSNVTYALQWKYCFIG